MLTLASTRSRIAAVGLRILTLIFRWLGHAAALIFWSTTVLFLIMKMIFDTGVDVRPLEASPNGRYVLGVSHADPGAMGTARQSFAMRRGSDGPFEAFVELKASPAVAHIDHEWEAASIVLKGVPPSSLRQIMRSGKPTGTMVVHFGVDE